ncbi:HVA22-like protein a isoform X3 [Rosa rugosa]|uniref:HVA22-like protein a isoform X3 n=1 Tax=Rosa rugosa TaxID=74645 RepID=UPI002B40348B|nr:HVA22-like protein a isoform X3 [Rosa rugosa]
MGWLVFLKLSAKFFTVLSWPSFSLVYALYASIQAVQSDSHSRNQRCLAYWVLFALYKISESTLAKLFYWLPLSPYTKGVITVLLVLPYFHGASYLYGHFIRSYIAEYSFIWKWNFLSIPRVEGIFSREDSHLDVVDKSVIRVEPQESARPVLFQVCSLEIINCEGVMEKGPPTFMTSCTEKEMDKGLPASNSETTVRESALPSSPKKIQREWSCALCLINATSENCLKMHFQGDFPDSLNKIIKEDADGRIYRRG